jgi:hypothetical protein
VQHSLESLSEIRAESATLDAMSDAFRNASIGARVTQDLALYRSFALDELSDGFRGVCQRGLDDVADTVQRADTLAAQVRPAAPARRRP